MSDPLHPPLADFVFTAVEAAAVALALSTDKPWEHEHEDLTAVKKTLTELKNRIRTFHMLRQGSKCCYCRMNLHGGGSFIVDREHIVPKDKYKDLAYEISNLSVACKRCNMQFKKADTAFLVDRNTILRHHTSADQYLFIHPNFEKYSLFIQRLSVEDENHTFVKYNKTGHPKAEFTYNYFDLRSLETNSFDEAQGINTSSVTTFIKERLEQEIQTMG